jgi:hypothetical protein
MISATCNDKQQPLTREVGTLLTFNRGGMQGGREREGGQRKGGREGGREVMVHFRGSAAYGPGPSAPVRKAALWSYILGAYTL